MKPDEKIITDSADADRRFMRRALAVARKSAAEGEVPIGAVIVKDGNIISTGRNRRETKNNGLLHAEITAIDRACKKLGCWRLVGCTLYVTLEPCPMCLGAAINTRIDRICFGARDAKAGCLGSVVDLNSLPFNHKCEITEGVLSDECSAVLSDFFKELRKTKKQL